MLSDIILKCFVASAFLFTFVTPSSSVNRNNYNVYNYDQTTPQFTPDGRLLQVEYASSAADLSPPLVVLEFSSPFSTSSTKTSRKNSDDENESLSYPCTVLITVPRLSSSPQNRIIIIEENSDDLPNSSLGRNRNPRPRSYCVAMSGILADSLALLQTGIKMAGEHSLQYQDSLGMESLAQALADECQSRVFSGGLRPYGSTLLLCGYDDGIEDGSRNSGDDNANDRRKAFSSLIYQTDPSGGILQHRPQHGEDNERFGSKTAASKKKQSKRHDVVQSQVRCIIGGSPGTQRQLHKHINQGMMRFEQQRNHKKSPFSLADRIANVAKILIKETDTVDNNEKTSDRIGNSRSKSRKSEEPDYPLEVVIVSPKLGCHRLQGNQLQAIRELINRDK